jgi:hypothetical protein
MFYKLVKMLKQKRYNNKFFTTLLLLLLDPGSGRDKIRILDKHPGSATLVPRYGTYLYQNLYIRNWDRSRCLN